MRASSRTAGRVAMCDRVEGAPEGGLGALAAELEAIAFENGVDVIGFGDVNEATPPGFRHLPVGISVGVVHPAMRAAVEELRLDESGSLPRNARTRGLLEARMAQVCANSGTYDHRDVEGQDLLENTLRRLARNLRRRGYRYFCCPAEVDPMESPFTARMIRRFSHKAAATCAGLGSVGRHGLLNHPQWGPYLSWATILTNAPLPVGEPVTESDCGDCRACVEACPSGAISGRPWRRADGMKPLVDVERCRRLLDEREQTTGQRICGRCAVTCVLSRLD
ncbi:MAG: hypothetical protein Kow00129_08600 [Thermoleophilia bacterium]